MNIKTKQAKAIGTILLLASVLLLLAISMTHTASAQLQRGPRLVQISCDGTIDVAYLGGNIVEGVYSNTSGYSRADVRMVIYGDNGTVIDTGVLTYPAGNSDITLSNSVPHLSYGTTYDVNFSVKLRGCATQIVSTSFIYDRCSGPAPVC